MGFNDALEQYSNDKLKIEDVIYTVSRDRTRFNVTLCGPFGKELVTADICDATFEDLMTDYPEFNYIQD